MSKTILLIPSYQPTVLCCELLEELRRTDPTPIVVVDDGSGLAYQELFQRASQVADTVVLTNAINLGKGAAFKHGMNHILVNYPDCIGIVTADADGQHSVDDILKVADELRACPTEAVLGSRDFKRDVPLRSKLGNIISRYVYRFLIGLNLSDTQTGLRGIPRRLMELSLSIRSNRYEFETEQIITAKAPISTSGRCQSGRFTSTTIADRTLTRSLIHFVSTSCCCDTRYQASRRRLRIS